MKVRALIENEQAPNVLPFRRLAEMAGDPKLTAEPSWILKPIFERGSLANVYGPGKIGKSTMLASIAVHVATGRDWAGFPVEQGPVLWIDLEQGERRLLRNFTQISGWEQADIAVVSSLGTSLKLSEVRATVADLQPALVVIDSLGKFCQVEDDNDNAAWQAALKPIEHFARECPAAVVFVDHDRKGEGEHGRAMRGASSKLAAFDVAVHVQRDGEGSRRRLKGVSREIGDFSYTVERTATGYSSFMAQQPRNEVIQLLRDLGDPVTVKVLHHELTRRGKTISEKSVRNHIESAVLSGAVIAIGTGTKNDPTRYSAGERAA